MEASAKLKYLLMSARKVRYVGNEIRGKKVDDALSFLAVMRGMKRAVSPIEKLLKSAVANMAQANPNVDSEKLVVKTLCVDSATAHKRIRARAKGSAYRRLKRSSHITIVISD